jgi:hypothetical protein
MTSRVILNASAVSAGDEVWHHRREVSKPVKPTVTLNLGVLDFVAAKITSNSC